MFYKVYKKGYKIKFSFQNYEKWHSILYEELANNPGKGGIKTFEVPLLNASFKHGI